MSHDNWLTPPKVIDAVRDYTINKTFDLDPCSNITELSAPVIKPQTAWYLELNGDSLSKDWSGFHSIWVNPPYSNKKPWAKKCWDVSKDGKAHEIFLLVPCDTETSYWQTYCALPHAQAVCFWNGRISFWTTEGSAGPARFPSCIVYYGNHANNFAKYFRNYGVVWV